MAKTVTKSPTSDDRTKAIQLAVQFTGTSTGQDPVAAFKKVEPLVDRIAAFIANGYWPM